MQKTQASESPTKADETENQRRQNFLEKLERMRLLDDSLMTKCFEDNIECTELVLHIILNKQDLKVTEARTEYNIKNLQGRSVRLDIYAVDSTGKKYNIEMERNDKRATPKRVRYNSSLMDANSILPGEDVELLPKTYVIMITENDYWGEGKPIYSIDKYVSDSELAYDDESYIIYINGAFKAEADSLSPLEKLIHDFNCINPNDMYFDVLANRVQYLKSNEEGVKKMGQVMDELIEEYVNEERVEFAIKLLRRGKLPIEEIAECTSLSIDKIKELEADILHAY
ncbi:MAG: PD-(D/E)XK nuclease family transposase [Lachnospiraceae bacterium]|nr:PD-(D/E)XK nuclease family transposase [Lachnospiraceae bacterium]